MSKQPTSQILKIPLSKQKFIAPAHIFQGKPFENMNSKHHPKINFTVPQKTNSTQKFYCNFYFALSGRFKISFRSSLLKRFYGFHFKAYLFFYSKMGFVMIRVNRVYTDCLKGIVWEMLWNLSNLVFTYITLIPHEVCACCRVLN